MRYLNVTIIDSTGAATHTQISGHPRDSFGPGIDWMEAKMLEGARRGAPYIACFIYDTRTGQLMRYEIDGMIATLRRGAR